MIHLEKVPGCFWVSAWHPRTRATPIALKEKASSGECDELTASWGACCQDHGDALRPEQGPPAPYRTSLRGAGVPLPRQHTRSSAAAWGFSCTRSRVPSSFSASHYAEAPADSCSCCPFTSQEDTPPQSPYGDFHFGVCFSEDLRSHPQCVDLGDLPPCRTVHVERGFHLTSAPYEELLLSSSSTELR